MLMCPPFVKMTLYCSLWVFHILEFDYCYISYIPLSMSINICPVFLKFDFLERFATLHLLWTDKQRKTMPQKRTNALLY